MGDSCCRGLNVNVKKVAAQTEGQLVMIGVDIWFLAYHFMSHPYLTSTSMWLTTIIKPHTSVNKGASLRC